MKTLLYQALITDSNCSRIGSVVIEDSLISELIYDKYVAAQAICSADEVVNCQGLRLLPGCIDDQVHFRDPGLTHKGDIESESRAAIAGGITSFMDMPNTQPSTTTRAALDAKIQRAAEVSWANYSFFFGGTNENIEEIKQIPASMMPGLKLFLGASTGNMLVDNKETLRRIFGECDLLIATHCENESLIRANKAYYTTKYGQDLDIGYHGLIRSAEACYRSSAEAIELADRLKSRLHVLHISSERELSLFSAQPLTNDKLITSEVCVHHLWFSDQDYLRLGNRIKWNPSIKQSSDRQALRVAVREGRIDIVATDHAPHLLNEKEGSCLKAASGGPLVEHSLLAMLDLCRQGIFTIEEVVSRMAHRPADLFGICDRGYVRPGYKADLVLVDPNSSTYVSDGRVLSRCGWSPFDGHTFSHRIHRTYVNGALAYDQGTFAAYRPPVDALMFRRK